MEKVLQLVKSKWKILILLCAAGVAVVLTMIAVCWQLITPNGRYILAKSSDIPVTQADVGLVLGAGVASNGKPYKELQARLDSAADALAKGYVKKLILSGDNRFEHYNEPAAMKNYMIQQKHISEKKIFLDYAGRSTYESCERASKIFGQHKLIIFSAHSHLPRAIYLCRHFGVESYGVSSGLEANNSTRREILARVKAVYNIKIKGEHTVLGEKVNLD